MFAMTDDLKCGGSFVRSGHAPTFEREGEMPPGIERCSECGLTMRLLPFYSAAHGRWVCAFPYHERVEGDMAVFDA